MFENNDLNFPLSLDLEEQVILSSAENKVFQCQFINNYSKIIVDVNLILNYLNYSIIIEIKKKMKYLTLILMILFLLKMKMIWIQKKSII